MEDVATVPDENHELLSSRMGIDTYEATSGRSTKATSLGTIAALTVGSLAEGSRS